MSAPSQRRTSETSGTPSPANATIVTSRPVHCDDIHSTTTAIITPSTIDEVNKLDRKVLLPETPTTTAASGR